VISPYNNTVNSLIEEIQDAGFNNDKVFRFRTYLSNILIFIGSVISPYNNIIDSLWLITVEAVCRRYCH